MQRKSSEPAIEPVIEAPLLLAKNAKSAIEEWPISRFVPYARNPRKNDDAVDRMASSIREFGFKIPVLARSSGDVVDGHLRLKAAHKLGITEIPVMLCDEWTEGQVKAFRLMVNRSVGWAEWDEELLALEFEDLKALDLDLSFTGFDEQELTKYLTGSEAIAPTGFGEYDESIETEHECPKCGYRWSGKASSSRHEVSSVDSIE